MADAYGAFGLNPVSDVETMMDIKYRLRPAKYQFYRHTNTARWFNPRTEGWHGIAWNFKVYLAPSTPIRRKPIETATGTGTGGEFPRARDRTFLNLTIFHEDLRMFQGTCNINDYADIRTRLSSDAIENAAQGIINDMDRDFAAQMNNAVHQEVYGQMATINAVYKADGDTYPGSSATTAFFQITDGSIAQFVKGMTLDIRDNAHSASVQAVCLVNDVITTPNGPASGGSIAGIGPGIVVTCRYTEEGNYGDDQHFDNVEVNVNDSGHSCDLVMTTEGVTANFHGLPDWMSESTDVYKDAAGSDIDRDALGNQWGIPYIADYTDSGSAVNFDMETHLDPLADDLPMRVSLGRDGRKGTKGLEIRGGMLAITTPKLCNYMVKEAKDTQRFTSMLAGTWDAAKKKRHFGSVGFDGVVYHSPSLPWPIAFQADPVARPEKLTIVDPNSFFWLTEGGGPAALKWLDQGGSRFQPVRGTNLRRTFYQDAAAYAAMYLACDQIGAAAEIQGVKSA